MTAVSTTTSTDTRTVPLSRPLSSPVSLAPRSLRSVSLGSVTGPISRTDTGISASVLTMLSQQAGPDSARNAPANANASVDSSPSPSSVSGASAVSELNAKDADASGARLIIPAISLRTALSEPTRDGRLASLHEVNAFEVSPFQLDIATEEATNVVDSSATVPARPRVVAEATVRLGRTWRFRSMRIGKATAAAFGFGGVLVILGLVASTTDTADRLAARIQLSLEGDVIPAAAADPAPRAPVTSTLAAPQPSDVADSDFVDLELPATPSQVGAKATARPAARPARPAAPRSAPIRLRSPY